MKTSEYPMATYGRSPYNPEKCAESVSGDWRIRQCGRKPGHGDRGLFCAQHAKRHPAPDAEVTTIYMTRGNIDLNMKGPLVWPALASLIQGQYAYVPRPGRPAERVDMFGRFERWHKTREAAWDWLENTAADRVASARQLLEEREDELAEILAAREGAE